MISVRSRARHLFHLNTSQYFHSPAYHRPASVLRRLRSISRVCGAMVLSKNNCFLSSSQTGSMEIKTDSDQENAPAHGPVRGCEGSCSDFSCSSNGALISKSIPHPEHSATCPQTSEDIGKQVLQPGQTTSVSEATDQGAFASGLLVNGGIRFECSGLSPHGASWVSLWLRTKMWHVAQWYV